MLYFLSWWCWAVQCRLMPQCFTNFPWRWETRDALGHILYVRLHPSHQSTVKTKSGLYSLKDKRSDLNTIKENYKRKQRTSCPPQIGCLIYAYNSLIQVKSAKSPLGLKSVTFQRSVLGAEVFNMSKPAGSTSGCLDILNVKSSE